MSNRLACRQCGQPITFDNKHISQRTGKKIPLDVETNEPHDCPAYRDQPQQPTQQRRYLQCSKGCGNEIYFDANHSKSQTKIQGCHINVYNNVNTR